MDRRTVVTRDHVGSIPTSGAGTKGDRCPWSSAHSSDTREGLVRLQGPPLDARSSNGRTPGSDPGNRGSKPCLAVITAPSANGQAAGFSVRRSEFESPWCHHLRDVAQLAARAVRDREAARSNRAIPTRKSRKPQDPPPMCFWQHARFVPEKIRFDSVRRLWCHPEGIPSRAAAALLEEGPDSHARATAHQTAPGEYPGRRAGGAARTCLATATNDRPGRSAEDAAGETGYRQRASNPKRPVSRKTGRSGA